MGIVWRCQDYKISKQAVHKRLERIAFQRGLPLTIIRKQWHLDSRVSDEQAQSEELRKDGLPYETSLLHNAFSVARMSLQDRHYIRSIVESLGENAHVLKGDRILVLYEADLLSTESVLLLQRLLEMRSESGNITIWMTVRETVAYKLRDWFLDIPIPLMVPVFHPWAPVIWDWIEKTRQLKKHELNHIEAIRQTIYSLLQRNMRWFDIHQIFLELIMEHSHELGESLTYKLLP
jgi:SAM-dependent methyltransferase